MWLVLGSAGLVLVAPELARNNLFAPRVFAVTHAFTLGFILNAITGAMHQFLPAVTGTTIRYPRTARASFLLFFIGTPMLVAGFWWWNPAMQAVGWIVLLAAVGCASMNLFPVRRRALRNHHVGALATLAHSALGIAMLLAALRIGSASGWWHVQQPGFIIVHFHLGMAGFGTLTALAFGSRMLPAFLGSPVEGTKRIRLIAALIPVGLLVMSLGLLMPGSAGVRVGGALVAAGGLVHLHLLDDYFRLRKPGRFDPGLGLIAVAVVGYALTLLLGILLLLLPGARLTLWGGYAFLAIIGWLVTLILGVMHRVAPRLVVLGAAGRDRSLSPAARRAELVHDGIGWGTCAALAAGTALTGLGIIAGQSAVGRVGAVFVLGAALLTAAQAVWIARVSS